MALVSADPSLGLLLTEGSQVLCLEDLLQGRDVNHSQLPQNGPEHRVEEHGVPQKAYLQYQLGLQREGHMLVGTQLAADACVEAVPPGLGQQSLPDHTALQGRRMGIQGSWASPESGRSGR